MNFIRKLLGLNQKPKPTFESVFSEEEKAIIKSLALPGVRLEPGGGGFSRLGGLPDMSENVPWPHDAAGVPLAFLAQLDLSALPSVTKDMGLPDKGCLWVFYAQDQSAGGWHPQHKWKWRVIYADQTPNSFIECAVPKGLSKIYSAVSVKFKIIETYPYNAPEISALNLNGIQSDLYDDMGATPEAHMLGGHCSPIQNPDMALDCQLASSGIECGDPKAYQTVRARALSAGASDWRFLLQLASDEETCMNWGDGGTLYFWIREDDLKAKRFDKVWMVAQCY